MGARRYRWYVLSLGVLALAAGLRLWRISSVPPGLHHDEAFNLLSAQAILAGESLPLFIPGNFGNEPMMAYLTAAALAALGPTVWAGRLVAAWAGLVSVAAALRAGQELYPRRPVGLLAGLTLAGLYWHLTFSRFGTQPVLACAAATGTMAAVAAAMRTGGRQAYCAAGFGLAFGLYSYVAFRLFPLVLLAAGIAYGLAEPGLRRARWRGALLGAGLAMLACLPLTAYFVQHPDQFFMRASQTTEALAAAPQPVIGLADNTLRVIGGLFVDGDHNWRQNLPGRPAFDLVQAGFLLVGLAVALVRAREPQTWAVVAWAALGLLPSVLTEFPPQFFRMSWATPGLALLIGLGIERACSVRNGRRAVAALVAAGLGLSLAATGRDYFQRWAGDRNLFIAFDVGLKAIGDGLRRLPEEAVLYETPVYRDYPTFEFSLGPEAYPRFRAFNSRECFVAPAVTTAPTAFAVITLEDPATLPRLRSAFPAGREVQTILWDSQPYATIYAIPAGERAAVTPAAAAAVDYGWARLLGFSLQPDQWMAGGRPELSLTWLAERPMPAALTLFVHLIGAPRDGGSQLYAQHDAQPCLNAYPTWQWVPGEVIVDRISLDLPADLPPGPYSLRVGWYDSATLIRLPARDLAGRGLGDSVELAPLTVAGP